jgi:hypothetical protein
MKSSEVACEGEERKVIEGHELAPIGAQSPAKSPTLRAASDEEPRYRFRAARVTRPVKW